MRLHEKVLKEEQKTEERIKARNKKKREERAREFVQKILTPKKPNPKGKGCNKTEEGLYDYQINRVMSNFKDCYDYHER